MVARRCVLGYLAVSFVQVWSTGRSEQAQPVDAIVVMGAAQYDGEPSPQLAARLDHVVELWPRGLAAFVVVTGGNRPGDRFTEAQASADYLAERGVPAMRSSARTQGRRATSRCAASPNCSAERGLDEVLIVTDPYHALRSRLIAEEVGLRAHVSPTPDSVVTGGAELVHQLEEAAGVAIGRIIGFSRLTALDDAAPVGAEPRRYTPEPLRGEWCNWQHSRFWFCY